MLRVRNISIFFKSKCYSYMNRCKDCAASFTVLTVLFTFTSIVALSKPFCCLVRKIYFYILIYLASIRFIAVNCCLHCILGISQIFQECLTHKHKVESVQILFQTEKLYWRLVNPFVHQQRIEFICCFYIY